VFVVADYNAIEARCLGWLSGEKWVEAEFAGAGKIYEATAATMFGVNKDQLVRALDPITGCDKCGHCLNCAVRSKGKVSNLALGYAGGAGALVTMGAEEAGIDIGNYKDLHRLWEAAGKPGKFHEWNKDAHDYPELLRLRDLYRDASPATVRFWKLCARAWDLASEGKGARFGQNQVVTIMRDGPHNRMVLPSDRSIWYRFAKSHPDPKNPDRIDGRSFIGKSTGVGHMRTQTHGGKLTENVTQAVARDVLFDLIMRIEAQSNRPGRIVLHVHDEVVLEVPEASADQRLADIIGLMGQAPSWGAGLAVKGEGKIMERYGK
jgi:DNA polymerase